MHQGIQKLYSVVRKRRKRDDNRRKMVGRNFVNKGKVTIPCVSEALNGARESVPICLEPILSNCSLAEPGDPIVIVQLSGLPHSLLIFSIFYLSKFLLVDHSGTPVSLSLLLALSYDQ